MSFIAGNAARRAFLRAPIRRVAQPQPLRRYATEGHKSKLEEAGLDTAPKRDPELYVRYLLYVPELEKMGLESRSLTRWLVDLCRSSTP